MNRDDLDEYFQKLYDEYDEAVENTLLLTQNDLNLNEDGTVKIMSWSDQTTAFWGSKFTDLGDGKYSYAYEASLTPTASVFTKEEREQLAKAAYYRDIEEKLKKAANAMGTSINNVPVQVQPATGGVQVFTGTTPPPHTVIFPDGTTGKTIVQSSPYVPSNFLSNTPGGMVIGHPIETTLQIPANKCDCGSWKACGAARGSSLHDNKCPWSKA